MTNFSGLTDELGFMLAKAEIATPEPDKAGTSEPEPSQQLTAAGEALNASATWFRAAARDDGALDGRAFLEATSALTPWLDSLGCGITSMVNVNVAKLETRFGADDAFDEIEVGAAVADEASRGAKDDDDSVFVASLWNARILSLIGRLLESVLACADLATDPRTLCEIITASYEDTLARHHNWAVKPAAKALLLMTPDRADLLADFGYANSEWNTRARSDFAEFVAAVEACLGRLAAIYAPYDEAI